MTQSVKYDGATLNRVRSSTIQVTESADQGAIGTGRMRVNDTPGTQEILGQKDLAFDQTDCANPVLGRGFVGDEMQYQRGAEAQGAAREIDVPFSDLNAMLGFLVFDGDSAANGDRPAETVDERLAWLETWCATNLPGLFFGTRIGSSDHGMDANNYRDQHPTEVLAGIILAAESWNFYVRDFGTGDGPELVCRNDNTSEDDTSDLSISNVPGEADGETVFAPLKDFILTKRSGNVGSRIRYSFASDTVVEERTATADAFNGRRDLTASDTSVKEPATAHKRAQDALWQHHTEEIVLEGSVLLTPEAVNLASQGDRIGVRLQHLQALGNGLSMYDPDELVYCRILERSWQTLLKPTRLYPVKLKLSPQEAGPPAGKILQYAFGHTADGGGTLTLPNPVTIGSTLVFTISASHHSDPSAPNTAPGIRWGSGAWTKKPNNTARNGYGSGGGTQGVAIWTKIADATDQTGYIGEGAAAIAIYELADVDLSSATTVYVTEQTAANPMPIGSLGTPASGSVNILVGNWADASLIVGGVATQPTWDGTLNGWVLDQLYVVPAVYPRWNPPVSYMAHQIGDGGAMSAVGTRSALQWLPGQWCGAAISLPPV